MRHLAVMSNLTLYTTRAGAWSGSAALTTVVILDSDGNRVLARYFQPPQAGHVDAATLPAGLAPLVTKNPYQTLKEQRALEREIWEKARRASGACVESNAVLMPGDVFQYANNLVLFKSSYDVYLMIVAPERENELLLHSYLTSLVEALDLVLGSQLDKRTILENLDLASLTIDESIDDGYVWC